MSNSHLKLLILGGYGTFGGRLAQLLSDEPAVTLVIAGRSAQKASDFCASLPSEANAVAVAVDRDTNLEQRVAEVAPDIIVDATGPFQDYGDDPYRVVKAAINAGVHYLDLADGSQFVRGISQFDRAAKESGVTVLTGVSSFPVLTAAVVRYLAADLEHVDTISGGIAPSPYAGVGLNVVRAIAGYAGQPITVRRNGEDASAYALTETRRFTIAPSGYLPLDSLMFSLVDVPDLQLLGDVWPNVQSVWMGAAPVPAVLHGLLRWLANAVKWRLLPSLGPLGSLMYRTISVLRWGEHRGGMFVEIEGRTADGSESTRSWHLVAEGEDGPYIPSMAIEAVVRNWLVGKIPEAGARPAIGELDLSDYEKLFARRAIVVGQRISPDSDAQCLYGKLLGDAWATLPSSIRNLHAFERTQTLSGRAVITRGKGILARFVASVFRFPAAAPDIDVAVTFERSSTTETWTRDFGGSIFSTNLFAGRGRRENLLCEQFGPIVFGMALVNHENRLRYVVRRWSIFGIPLPKALAPSGESFEFDADGRFNFHVEITAPIVGFIIRYEGYLEQN